MTPSGEDNQTAQRPGCARHHVFLLSPSSDPPPLHAQLQFGLFCGTIQNSWLIHGTKIMVVLTFVVAETLQYLVTELLVEPP